MLKETFNEVYALKRLELLTESEHFIKALIKMKGLKDHADTSDLSDILKTYKEFQKLKADETNQANIDTMRQNLLTDIKDQMEKNSAGMKDFGIIFLKDVNALLTTLRNSIEKIYGNYRRLKGH